MNYAGEEAPLLKPPNNSAENRSALVARLGAELYINNDGPMYTRFQSLSGVCLLVSVTATSYAFGILSELLKDDLGYSQNTLDWVASIGNTGLYMSFFVGLALDRFGYKSVVKAGGAFILIGFAYIWLAIMKYIPSNHYTVSLFYFLSQTGVSCHIVSAVTVAVKLFPPEARGTAVGLSKGYFGISSAVLGVFAGGFFTSFPALYVLFIAVFIPSVAYLGVSISNLLPPHLVPLAYERDRGFPTSLEYFLYHWVGLFLALLFLGYIEYAWDLNEFEMTLCSAALLLIIFSLLLVPYLYGDLTIDPRAQYPAASRRRRRRGSNGSYANKGFRTFSEKDQPREVPQLVVSSGSGTDVGASGVYSEFESDSDTGTSYSDVERQYAAANNNPNSQQGTTISAAAYKKLYAFSDAGSSVGDVDDSGSVHSATSASKYWTNTKSAQPQQTSNDYAHTAEDVLQDSIILPNNETELDQLNPQPPHDQLIKHVSFSSVASDYSEYTAIAGCKESDDSDCFYGKSIPISEAIKTWRLWAIYYVFMVICGSGLMVIYNVEAIAEAYHKEPSAFFVTLVSLANGLGRVAAGLSSDKLGKYTNFSKLQMLGSISFLMCVTHVMLAFGDTSLLFPCLLLVGLLFGANVAIIAVVVTDIFGDKYVATNFGLVDSAPIPGSFIFATIVVSLFYQENTVTDDGTETCIGVGCFRYAFLVNAAACLLGCIVCLYTDCLTPRPR